MFTALLLILFLILAILLHYFEKIRIFFNLVWILFAVYVLYIGYLSLNVSTSYARVLLMLSVLWTVVMGWTFLRSNKIAHISNHRKRHLNALLIHALVTISIYWIAIFDPLDIEIYLSEIVLILVSVLSIRAFSATRSYKISKNSESLKELPTISLLIPARNEDHAMTKALESAKSIKYPKLEILVLDDCSQDKTGQIIKSFASQGIRFIKGKEPPKDWIGKNYALEQLYQEASGEFLLFADVDVRINEDDVYKLISYLKINHLEMISVIPKDRGFNLLNTILTSCINYIELAFSKFVPTSTSCFLISRSVLADVGGFESHKSQLNIVNSIAKKVRNYSLLIADNQVDITIQKRTESLIESNIRHYYGASGLNTAHVFIILVLGYFMFLYPILELISDPSLLKIMLVFIVTLSYMRYLYSVQPKGWLLGVLLFPVIAPLHLLLLLVSMFSFESGKSDWKSRNICYPQLEIIPRLPKL